MGATTGIEWCKATWNPITGCFHKCAYCYARRIAQRFCGKMEQDGTVHDLRTPMRRVTTDEDGVKHDGKRLPYPYGFDPTFHRYRLEEPQYWREAKTIFVGSMTDMFGEWVSDEWLQLVFHACRAAPQHTYIFLTKNPARFARFRLPEDKNFWFGVTATDHQSAEAVFRHLPPPWKYNTFLSMEPLMGNVNLSALAQWPRWIIVGAMTGPGAKKHQPRKEWVTNITRWADGHGIPVFMKDSLIPIVGEANMRRDFPWGAK